MSKPFIERARGLMLPRLASATALLGFLALTGCASSPSADRSVASQPGSSQEQAAADHEQDPALDAAAAAEFARGLDLLRQAQYPQAAEVLSPIAKAHPRLPGPLVNLAIAYIHLDRQQEAVAALQQAMKADPEHPVALNWMAILHRRSGRFTEAQATYQRLLAAHPEYRYGHLNLGILCDLYLQQPACALEHYKRYQELGGEQEEEGQQVAMWISDLERRSGR